LKSQLLNVLFNNLVILLTITMSEQLKIELASAFHILQKSHKISKDARNQILPCLNLDFGTDIASGITIFIEKAFKVLTTLPENQIQDVVSKRSQIADERGIIIDVKPIETLVELWELRKQYLDKSITETTFTFSITESGLATSTDIQKSILRKIYQLCDLIPISTDSPNFSKSITFMLEFGHVNSIDGSLILKIGLGEDMNYRDLIHINE
jgi:hypothetical protein